MTIYAELDELILRDTRGKSTKPFARENLIDWKTWQLGVPEHIN